jgi:hypothetical protein
VVRTVEDLRIVDEGAQLFEIEIGARRRLEACSLWQA